MESMRPMGELITEALREAGDDEALARSLIANGALERIILLGTCDAAEVQEVLGYSGDSLRAQLSKAKRGTGAFPLPRINGRLWSRADIEAYQHQHARKVRRRKQQRRPDTSTADIRDIRDTTGMTGYESDGENADIGSVGGNGDVTGIARADGFDPELGDTR